VTFGIRAKLLAGFGAVLILLAGVASLAVVKLTDANTALDSAVHLEMAAVATTLDADLAATATQRELRQSLLVTSQADNAAAKKAFDADVKRFEDDLRTLETLLYTPQGKAKLATLQQAYATWKPLRDQALNLSLQNQSEAGLAVLTGDANTKAVAGVNAAITDLVQFKTDRANQVVSTSQSDGNQARTLVIGLSALAMLLGFGIAFLLARRIAQTASEVQRTVTSLADRCATWLSEALDAFAEGDLTVAVEPVTPAIARYGKDELGQTAAATNRLRERIVACIGSYEQARAGLGELVGSVQRSAETV
jgi:methyl-accepting chemotaxis protein